MRTRSRTHGLTDMQITEVAHAIYFLVTEQSSYINGTELHINGGQHV